MSLSYCHHNGTCFVIVAEPQMPGDDSGIRGKQNYCTLQIFKAPHVGTAYKTSCAATNLTETYFWEMRELQMEAITVD